MNTKIKAVLYARVSSEEQNKEGFSIPSQRKLLNKYASENGFEVIEEYIDIETAKQAGRSNFNRMIKFLSCETKKKSTSPLCRTLLVEKTDRLYRNLKDWVTMDEMDIQIHFVKEGVIISSDSKSTDKFMHGIKVLMAKNYIDNLSEEVKKGLIAKAESGLYPMRPPIGYRSSLLNGKKAMEPDPVQAAFVKKLFDLYSAGGVSIREIGKEVANLGFTYKKSGKKIPKSVVHRLLQNPIYYGEFRWSGLRYKGSHEPLVKRELWDMVQRKIRERANFSSRTRKHNFSFSGFVKCGRCGTAVVGEIHKGKYIYYHCSQSRGKCKEPYIREEAFAKILGKPLKKLVFDKEIIDWMIAALKESHKDEKRHHKEAVEGLRKQRDRILPRLEKMYEDKLDGVISKDFYLLKRAQYEEERDRIDYHLSQHSNANLNYLDTGVDLLELAKRAYSLYLQQDPAEQRKLLNLVYSNCIFKNGKIKVEYRKPFNILALTRKEIQQIKDTSKEKIPESPLMLLGRDLNPQPSG